MADITQEKIHSIVEKQRAFFRTGTTLDIGWRKQQLKKLAAALEANHEELEKALAGKIASATLTMSMVY